MTNVIDCSRLVLNHFLDMQNNIYKKTGNGLTIP
ncbi:helix-turn-helix domain-containing protein [Bacillus cereus]|nr:helix-turn-helix domain-containing protein [Bacillus cereus]